MEVYESILPCSEVRFGSEREGRFVDVIQRESASCNIPPWERRGPGANLAEGCRSPQLDASHTSRRLLCVSPCFPSRKTEVTKPAATISQ